MGLTEKDRLAGVRALAAELQRNKLIPAELALSDDVETLASSLMDAVSETFADILNGLEERVRRDAAKELRKLKHGDYRDAIVLKAINIVLDTKKETDPMEEGMGYLERAIKEHARITELEEQIDQARLHRDFLIVRALRDEGKTISEIGRALDVTRQAVTNIRNTYLERELAAGGEK